MNHVTKRIYPNPYDDNLYGKHIVISTGEKDYHEKWNNKRDLGDFPHPFKLLLFGSTNSGKTTTIHNIIIKTMLGKKPFKRIFLFYGDGDTESSDYSKESIRQLKTEYGLKHWYNCSDIPSQKHFSQELGKSLLIIDDALMGQYSLTKKQLKKLNTLIMHVCTHKHLSMIIVGHDAIFIPRCVRSGMDIISTPFVQDSRAIDKMTGMLGVSRTKFEIINEYLRQNPHNTFTIDKTFNSPAPMRFPNIQTPAQIVGNKIEIIPRRKIKRSNKPQENVLFY